MGRHGFALDSVTCYQELWLTQASCHQNESRATHEHKSAWRPTWQLSCTCSKLLLWDRQGSTGLLHTSCLVSEPTAPLMRPHPKTDCPMSHARPQNHYLIWGYTGRLGGGNVGEAEGMPFQVTSGEPHISVWPGWHPPKTHRASPGNTGATSSMLPTSHQLLSSVPVCRVAPKQETL